MQSSIVRLLISRPVCAVVLATHWLASAILMVSVLPAAAATTLYVSTTGSDSNPGTQAAPFRTLSKANSVVAAGDTVHVLPGTYGGPVNLSKGGTSSLRIRWVSDTRWGAKLSDVNVSGSYVDIEGFDMIGGSLNVILALTGNYTRAISNHVHDLPLSCSDPNPGAGIDFYGGFPDYTAHHQEAISNLVEDIGQGPRDGTCSRPSHGIYLAVPFGKAVDNIVRRVTGYGIHAWHSASDLTIVNNTVVDTGTGGILIGNGGTGGSVSGNRNSFVANNIAVSSSGWAITECCDATNHGPNTYVNNLGWNNTYGTAGNIIGNKANGGTESGSILADPRL